MKILKKILWILLIVFIVIQFFRPEKNQSPVISPNDISKQYPVPQDVEFILAKACRDCHSNNTRYPRYNNIQPVSWWLDNHVHDGKRGLDFSEFKTYRISKQFKRMNDCINLVKKNSMPLDSYTWIHKDAILTDAEKQKLFDWCNSVKDSIKARYPADSLAAPKKV